MEMLFCVNARFASFWPIVQMDPVMHCQSQGEKIRKRHLRGLMWTANPHTLRINDAIAPPLYRKPLTSLTRVVS